MSCCMRKPTICICENRGADQLRSNLISTFVFSLPVQKYKKSYCSHPGVGVRVAQMLKFLVKVFSSPEAKAQR